jgi:hypothetical protein
MSRLLEAGAGAVLAVLAFASLSSVSLAEEAKVGLPWRADTAAAADSKTVNDAGTADSKKDVCVSLTNGLKARIEKLKADLNEWEAKIKAGQGNDASNKMRDERRTINDLNAMLAGVGCQALDVAFELTQPPAPVPATPAPPKTNFKHKHHHKI